MVEKYLVPKQSGEKQKTEDVHTTSSVKTSTNVVSDKNNRKDRVINDEYLQKRYALEEHMSMGDYDEFASVMSSCRDDLKEIKNTIKKAFVYGNAHENFKKRTNKNEIVESLQKVAEHVEVAFGEACNATNGAENVWNDIIHDAMDLQDSRSNKNGPEQALHEVL